MVKKAVTWSVLLATGLSIGYSRIALAQESPAESIRDHAYVSGGTTDQRLDFYWPAQARVTVLFIHGGSLVESGERRTSAPYRTVCAPLVAAGVGCATIDYRLAPTYKWPAMPRDVAAAVAAV